MVRRYFSTLITVLLLSGWFIWLRPIVLGGPASYIIVSGFSMEPTYYSRDLVVLQKQDHYEIGDVVAFRTEGGNVIHRVIDVTSDGYKLQGDNKDYPDPWSPTDEEILGKAWLHLPGAGRWLLSLKQPMTLALFIAAVTFVILGFGGSGSAKRASTGNVPPLMPMWRVRHRVGPSGKVPPRDSTQANAK
jgi:signal peptidase I